MGGHITLRAMVTTGDIRAGVIWAGVVASYDDLMNNWRRPVPVTVPARARRWRQDLIERFGTCLLYTSDAADERSSVDLGGRRIIKKKSNSRSVG